VGPRAELHVLQKRKIYFPAGNQAPEGPFRSLVIIPTTLFRSLSFKLYVILCILLREHIDSTFVRMTCFSAWCIDTVDIKYLFAFQG
jgi:hypothetical protein